MGYAEQSSVSGEEVVYTTGLHWITLTRPAFLSGIFLVFGIALMLNGDVGAGVFFAAFGAAVIALGLEVRGATEMAVTNARVIAKAGLLRRKTVELSLSKVECVIVDQGLLGRMLGYGNVVIRGTGGTGEPFRTVRSPTEFRRQVQQCTQDHTTVRLAWLDARH